MLTGCCSTRTITRPIPIRLRSGPAAKKLSPPAAIIISDGKVWAVYQKAKRDEQGKIVRDANGKAIIETVKIEKDLKGRVILESGTFLTITKELAARRAYDAYVKKTVKAFNAVGKPPTSPGQ
jgi:hypothetical protein